LQGWDGMGWDGYAWMNDLLAFCYAFIVSSPTTFIYILMFIEIIKDYQGFYTLHRFLEGFFPSSLFDLLLERR
jgi:hypothetical protein